MPVVRETSEVSPARLRREAAARRRKETRDRAVALRELQRISRQVGLPRGLTKEDRPSRLRTGETFTGQADVGVGRDLSVETTRRNAKRDRREEARRTSGMFEARESPVGRGRNFFSEGMAPAEDNTLISAVDLLTGIPTFIDDPSWENAGWVAASVLPIKPVLAPVRGVTRGAVAAGRATRQGLPLRKIAREGAEALIPAAGSRTGRVVERAFDRVMPRGAQLRQIALENARTARTRARVMAAPAEALKKLRLRANEEVALRLAAEGGTLERQSAFHVSRSRDGAREASERMYHGIQADLIKQASKWLENGPNGTIIIKKSAPLRIREAWRLLNVSEDAREGIYKSLGKLTDQRIAERIQAPGRKITGDEGFAGGTAYVADRAGTPGLGSATRVGPLRARVGTLNPRAASRQAQTFIRGGHRRAIAGVHRDPSLTNAYTGALKESGFFRTDVSNITSDSLATALKLDNIRVYRAQLLRAAVDTYQPGFVPIKAVPEAHLSNELKHLWDKLDVVERGNLTPRDMKRLGLTDQGLAEQLAKELFSPAADPTKGVKWVPAELVDQSAIGNLVSKTFDHGLVARSAGAALDLYNDLQRAAILYLNPAYGPVNLLGNTVMNLFQQGAFYPRNIMKAFQLWRGLSPEALATVRLLVGTGLTRAIGTAGTPGVKQITRTVGDLIQVGSDSMPRWTAFVHEASKAGLKTIEDYENLLTAARAGDEQSLRHVDYITRKANDAIVDFERLTPFERNVVSRVVFFYPWLRGATRYAARFPLEHPVQTVGLGYAGYKGKEYADDRLGPRPFYAQFDIPIPGREDEQGNPYVVNVRQLLTFTTPLELGQAAVAFATGDRDAPQVLENLAPGIQHGITALTGRNDFGQDVGTGVETFGRESVKDLPPSRFYEAFTTSDEEKQDRIYPRDRQDELIRVGLGGLAPKPYNIEAAQERVAEDEPQPPELNETQKLYKWALTPGSITSKDAAVVKEDVRVIQRTDAIVDAGIKTLARQLGLMRDNDPDTPATSKLTSRQEYAVRIGVLATRRPGFLPDNWKEQYRDAWESGDEKAIRRLKTVINNGLYFQDKYGRQLPGLLDELRGSVG